MDFPITKLTDLADADTLPVMKITSYPLEQRDYRPFAQAAAAVYEGGLLLRLWAFEAAPSPLSSLGFLLRGQSGASLAVFRQRDGGSRVLLEGTAFSPDTARWQLSPYDGEDLQGVYWGWQMLLPREDCIALWGAPAGELGRLRGNFYKCCEDPACRHFGSFYPARFPGHALEEESPGGCEIVDY